LLRSYRVLVDGREVGRIRSGNEVSFGLGIGRHEMHLQIDWCRSNTVEFDCGGSTLEFDCGSRFSGFRSLLGVRQIIVPDGDYLWLRRRTTARLDA
jgi:hypothetical protein